MQIEYGIKISTAQTSLTDYSLGLIDGVIRWVTGRPGLELWKEGIVLKDSIAKASQQIEIASCGGYSTMAGGGVTINNSEGLADIIEDLGLNLIQADVIIYSFRRETSEDEWEETQDWTGKIADWSEDENEIKIQFMDSFRGIHGRILKNVFTNSEFPNAPDSIKNKFIPISIGRVSKNKLFPIVRREVYNDVCTYLGTNYDLAPCTNYTSTGTGSTIEWTLHLKTIGKVFSTDELKGKFLTAVKSGSGTVRISGNSASASGITEIKIESPFSDTPTFWTDVANDTSIWYFQISNIEIAFMVSQNEITEFFENSLGRPKIFRFEDTTKEFEDISSLIGNFSKTDLDSFGYPGLSLISKPINTEGDARYYSFYSPSYIKEGVEVVTNAGLVTGTRPAPASDNDMPFLRDLSQADEYTWIVTSTNDPAFSTLKIPFIFPTPREFLTSNLHNIYFAWNFVSSTEPFSARSTRYNIKLVDFLLRQTDSLDTVDRGFVENVINLNSIPGKYFSHLSTAVNLTFENYKEVFQINETPNLTKQKDADIYPKVVVEATIRWGIGIVSELTLAVREVALIAEKNLSLFSEEIFSDIIGDIFGSTWDGRRTATNPVENIIDTIEHIFRNYDNKAGFIDVPAFDLLSDPITGTHKDRYVGRQLLDDPGSFDAIDELARFAFVGIVPKNNGKRAPKTWLTGSPVATHNDTNGTIIEGSIGEKELTSLADLYNEPQVNFGWNPGSEKFDGLLKITRLKEDSFPLEVTLDANGNKEWKTYAIGYEEGEYAEAKLNWDLCKLSQTRYGLARPLPSKMSDAYWFPLIETDWGLSSTYSAAKAYMRDVCRWTPFRKPIVSYKLPNTAEHAEREQLDRIAFSHSTYRNGQEFEGVIVGKALVPGQDKDYIEIRLMLDPNLSGLV